MTQVMSPPANAAVSQAESNYRCNLGEIARAQPKVSERLAGVSAEIEWLFARDGSLTAMLPGERWWGDCSLPLRAGQFMFKTMEIHGVVACFLNPIHAAHLRVTLAILEPQQAIISIVPDPLTLWVILHCHDFAAEFRAHRLWFATGDAWDADLADLFVQNAGLPTPSQFIRAISTDNGPADALIEPAQRILAQEADRRAGEVRRSIAAWSTPKTAPQKLCVIAPSRFRLWNDAPSILASVVREATPILQLDSDDPSSASPLALAQLACQCDAVAAANLSRADLPGIVPDEMPWLTWVTLGRIPTRGACGPCDRLLVADARWLESARAQGWKQDEAQVAGWPGAEVPSANEGFVALIADTRPLDPPPHVKEYSSQVLLWEWIENELTADPFLVGSDAEQYLQLRIERLRVAAESLHKTFFLEHLVVPAYQQGLAQLLIEHRLPVRLFGKGWQTLPQFADYAAGVVDTRQQFDQIVAGCAALVHAWPSDCVHPIDVLRRPVLRPFGRTREAFIREPVISIKNPTHTVLSGLMLASRIP